MIESLAQLVVTAPNSAGELVTATALLEAARSAPHIGRLSVLVRTALAPLLDCGPLAQHVQVCASPREEFEALARLRPDAVALLSSSFGAAWRAKKARVPLRLGASMNGRGWLLTHRVAPPTIDGRRFAIPTAHLQRDVLGLAGVSAASLHPRLHVTDDALAAQRDLLRELGIDAPYALCWPGATAGAAKLWPPERFARALDLLYTERGWRAVVSGAPAQDATVDAVARASRSGALSLAGRPRSLATLKALVKDAQVLLVGDAGPRWIAAAFDTPCVCVLGPSLPALAASSLELCSIVRVELECAPCGERTCPLGHRRCLQELAPERVAAAALEVCARKSSAGAAA